MKRNFVLLYDCPLKNCDKLWLYEGLQKYGEVKVISTGTKKTYFRIARFMPRIKLGKILVLILTYYQVIRALFQSNKNDIMVTWNVSQGVVMENLCKRFNIKRKIISFCWIELPTRNKKQFLTCLREKNFISIINNINLENDFKRMFKLKEWNGFFLPDVFDDKDEWIEIKDSIKKEYVFSGGVNNRDWSTLISAAEQTPNIKYILVTGKSDIKNKPQRDNITFYEELPANEYYKLMKGAYLTICPLKDNKVSGLINIIKSNQYGIPCITARLDVTTMYYPKEFKELLLYSKNDVEDLKKCIIEMWRLKKEEYKGVAEKCQKYLRKNYDPSVNVDKLIAEIRKRGWLDD